MTFDIFDNDAFSLDSLTDAIEDRPYVPSMVRSMNLFETESVSTTSIQMERTKKGISLVSTSPRGSEPEYLGREGRTLRAASVHHLNEGFRIEADEVQNLRTFGKESELETAMSLYNKKMERVNDNMDFTEEKHMLGAIQGKVLDADDTLLDDWFSFWGITQTANISFDFTADEATLRKLIRDKVQRQMLKNGEGVLTEGTKITAFCGDNFFDALNSHESYTGNTHTSPEAQRLTEEFGTAYPTMHFAGVDWINYRGDSAGKVAIGTNDVRFFPRGVRGLFKKAQAPAPYMETVNTLGKARYVKTFRDLQRDMWIKGEVTSCPLFYCTRPEVLLKGSKA
jgi:hypothetical protein